MAKTKTPVWVPLPTLADHLGVNPATIRRWVRKGLIPGVRRLPDGRYRFDLNRAEEIMPEVDPSEVAR